MTEIEQSLERAVQEVRNAKELPLVMPSDIPTVREIFSRHSAGAPVRIPEMDKDGLECFSQTVNDDRFLFKVVYFIEQDSRKRIPESASYEMKETAICPISGHEFVKEDGIMYEGRLCSPDAVAVCRYSGKVLPVALMTATADGLVSNECVEENYVLCDQCGNLVRKDSVTLAYKNGSEVHVCNDCLDSEYVRCDDCGDWFYCDEIQTARGGRQVCDGCRENYMYCNRCDELVPDEDFDFEQDMCCDCARELEPECITEYHGHSRGRMLFFSYEKGRKVWNHSMEGSFDEKAFKGLGVELEAEGHDDQAVTSEIKALPGILYEDNDDGNEVIFERDGSLSSGFELITRPHDRKSFFSMPWKEILEIYRKHGYRSHDGGNCGLHVHVSRSVFGRNRQEQSRSIAKVYRLFNERWDDIVKFSRRDATNWCRRMPVPASRNVKEIMEEAGRVRRIEGAHHVCLNNSNSDTFEFRLGRGTLKLESFLAWVDFICTVAWNARKVTFDDIGNIDLWLKGMKPETADRMREAGVFLDATAVGGHAENEIAEETEGAESCA